MELSACEGGHQAHPATTIQMITTATIFVVQLEKHFYVFVRSMNYADDCKLNRQLLELP